MPCLHVHVFMCMPNGACIIMFATLDALMLCMNKRMKAMYELYVLQY